MARSRRVRFGSIGTLICILAGFIINAALDYLTNWPRVVRHVCAVVAVVAIGALVALFTGTFREFWRGAGDRQRDAPHSEHGPQS